MYTQKYEEVLQFLTNLQAEVGHEELDFLHGDTLARAEGIADKIIDLGPSREDLVALELEMTTPEKKEEFSDLLHLAMKYAKARASFLELPPIHVSVVVPAYGENRRVMPRGTGPGADPDGEDFVIEKHHQVKWLFRGTRSTYQVIFVDDMSKPDPVRSGEAIQDMIGRYQVPYFKVLFLEDGVRNEKVGTGLVAKALAGIDFPKNSKKAGALYYGSAKAISEYAGGLPHLVFAIDCDLAVNAVHLGSLAYPIMKEGAVAAAASRRVPGAVLKLGSSRNIRANAARYFRKLMFKDLLPKDTQCGAKVFRAEALRAVLEEGMSTLDYSFDIELLTKLAIKFGSEKVVPVPVAVFDSAALTTTDSSVHFTIMKTQLRIAKELEVGKGEVFDQAVAVSELLTRDNEVWLRYLEMLAEDPALIEKQNRFETDILPEVLQLAQKASQ